MSKQKSSCKKKTGWWQRLDVRKRITIFFLGFILVCLFCVFDTFLFTSFIVARNPVIVDAQITAVYHSKGKYSPAWRFYRYEYDFQGTTYTGKTRSGMYYYFGGVGDTLKIRCNKSYPKWSIYKSQDNDEPIRLNEEEYKQICSKENEQLPNIKRERFSSIIIINLILLFGYVSLFSLFIADTRKS